MARNSGELRSIPRFFQNVRRRNITDINRDFYTRENVECLHSTTKSETYDQQKGMNRSNHHVFHRLHDCDALFGGNQADSHGGLRQIWIRGLFQGKHPMDVELRLVELCPEEYGLDEIRLALFPNLRTPLH